jgi:hypothetical protein
VACCASIFDALDADIASELSDDTPSDGQSESGTFSLFLRRKKRVEDF